ncbi:MAG: hypothetical protein NVV60_01435 [Luteimonas sp.]|nr:hypothetical protein [Luteimonas sp.]
MTTKPTPTRGGDYRVIGGKLVDEHASQAQPAATAETIHGDGSGEALPPIGDDDTPAKPGRKNRNQE